VLVFEFGERWGLRDIAGHGYDTGMETMNLTDDLVRAVEAHPEGVRLIDPASKRAYVLVAAEVFDRVKDLLADDPRDTYPAVERAFAEGWSDPKMDDYDHYDDLKK